VKTTDAEAGGEAGRSPTHATDLVVGTIQAHAASLLRHARRYSLCADDAQDAYQRALEIFLRRAATLDPERAPQWLATVVKHEALAVRQARLRLVGDGDVDLDSQAARDQAPPDEHVLRFEQVTRCAEALQRLKPQEARALWLQASGRSYAEIARETGWTATKVNRCITEGRRSFLARYASIESGAECDRWAPMVSAMADGEASREQIAKARPHLRNCPACRALARDARRQTAMLRAVFPLAAMAAAPRSGARADAGNLFIRLYEAIAGGVHDRAAASVLKAQALLDATSAGKVAAAAASAAALAGGGLAVVDHAVHQQGARPAHGARHASHRRAPRGIAPTAAQAAAGLAQARPRGEAGGRSVSRRAATQVESEFSLPASAAPAPPPPQTSSASDQASGEFGP
jgi:RNA polymerase sigma factor (sigma-70 family)